MNHFWELFQIDIIIVDLPGVEKAVIVPVNASAITIEIRSPSSKDSESHSGTDKCSSK